MKPFILHRSIILFILFIVISHVYALAANLSLIIKTRIAPGDTRYPLYHTPHAFDYNFYLSAITQSANGSWLMKDTLTTEPTNPTIFYFYYILTGKAASVFHLWPPVAYHLVRIISLELFFVSIFVLMKKILGVWTGFGASLFSIILTIPPAFLYNNPGAFKLFTPWWGGFEAIKRIDGLPHYLFGFSLLFISLVMILEYLYSGRSKYWIFAALCIFTAGILFPPAIMPLLFAIPSSTIALLLIKRINQQPIHINYKKTVMISILLIIGMISYLIIWRENYNGFPWDTWNRWEIAKWNQNEPTFDFNLFLSFGFPILCSIPALLLILKKPDLKRIFLLSWAIMPFVLLPFVNILGISKMRLVSSAPFVPFAALAAISIFQSPIFIRAKLRYLTAGFLIISSVGTSIFYLIPDVTEALHQKIYTNLYIQNSVWGTFHFMDKFLPDRAVVFSDEFAGSIIAAYTPMISFIGHPVHTKNYSEKKELVNIFYSAKTPISEARKIIQNYGIQYVYWGSDERNIRGTDSAYPFLKKVFEQEGVILYKVME